MNPGLFIRVVLFVILCELCDHVLFEKERSLSAQRLRRTQRLLQAENQ
jgi:hypothetical protein